MSLACSLGHDTSRAEQFYVQTISVYLINNIASKPSPWISCDNKELQILHKSSRYEPLNTRFTPIVQQFESKLRKVAFAIFPAKN